jgi:hypothetical protein
VYFFSVVSHPEHRLLAGTAIASNSMLTGLRFAMRQLCRFAPSYIAKSTFVAVLILAARTYGHSRVATKIDLEQAIQLVLIHNHALKAARTLIPQNQAEEITAATRPNPVFTYDDLFVPILSPSQLNESRLNTVTEFDAAFSWNYSHVSAREQSRLHHEHRESIYSRGLLLSHLV